LRYLLNQNLTNQSRKQPREKKPVPLSDDEYDILAEPDPVVEVVAVSTNQAASKKPTSTPKPVVESRRETRASKKVKKD